MGLTVAAALALFQEKFLSASEEMLMRDEDASPMFAAAETESQSDGDGRGFVIPFVRAPSGAGSATFSQAQNTARGSTVSSRFQADRWFCQPSEIPIIEGVAIVDLTAMQAAVNSGAGAAKKTIDLVRKSVDDVMDNVIRKRLEWQVPMSNGFGALAQVTSVSASPAFIVVPDYLANRFEEGMILQASTGESGAALAQSAGTRTVTGDAEHTTAGFTRILLDSDPTTGAWAAANSYVFPAGDRTDDSPYTARTTLTGQSVWTNQTAPTDTLFGVARSNNSKLGGRRRNLSGLAPVPALLALNSVLRKAKVALSKKTGVLYCSENAFDTLEQQKDAQKNVSMQGFGKYDMGFEGIMLRGIPILPDANIPDGICYAGPFRSPKYRPKLVHSGKSLVDLVKDPTSGVWLRMVDTAQQFEARLRFRGQYFVAQPGRYAVGYNFLT